MKIVGITTLVLVLLFTGCQKRPKPEPVKETAQDKTLKEDKLAQAIKHAKVLKEKHSDWNGHAPLPLTIVATAYIDNAATGTPEYQVYSKLFEKIKEDTTLIDSLSKRSITSKYSSIDIVDYESSQIHKERFNAAYINRLDSKAKLSDILRPDIETPSAELLIRLNLEELKKGNLTIEGYKTIKDTQKERNSYYFTLRKEGFAKLEKEAKNQAIVDSVLAALELGIPEYMAIDRKEMIKQGETFRMITDNPDGTATGRVYKFDIETEVEKLEKEKKQTKDPAKLAELNKRIEIVKTSRTYREYQTKQLLYTTPVSQQDVEVLNRYGYADIKHSFDELDGADVHSIATVLDYSLPDPFLIDRYLSYRKLHNAMGINIGDIRSVGKARHFLGEKVVKAGQSDTVADAVEGTVGTVINVGMLLLGGGGQGINTSGMLDVMRSDLKGLKEDPQRGEFYPVSHHDFGKEGLRIINNVKMANSVYGRVIYNSSKEDERVYSAVSHDETFLFQWTYSNDDKLGGIGKVYEINSMKLVKTITGLPTPKKTMFNGGNSYVTFDVNSDRVFLFREARNPILFDWRQEKTIQEYKGLVEMDGVFTKISVSPDGKYFMVKYSNAVHLWDISTAELVKLWTANDGGFFNKTWFIYAGFADENHLVMKRKGSKEFTIYDLKNNRSQSLEEPEETIIRDADLENGILTYISSKYHPFTGGKVYWNQYDVSTGNYVNQRHLKSISASVLGCNFDRDFLYLGDGEELVIIDYTNERYVHSFRSAGSFTGAFEMGMETTRKGNLLYAETFQPLLQHIYDLRVTDVINREY